MGSQAARWSAGAADAVIPRASLSGLGAPVPARNSLEARLVALWERILKVAPIGVEDHWYDLGGDSLGAAVLFAEIAAGLGKKLPLSAFLEADTVAKLAALMVQPAVRNKAAPIFNAAGKRAPLYCVHGLTGSGEFARRLAGHLGPEQPVIGFQALVEAAIGEPDDTVATMTADYLEILRQHQPRGAYRLIGWCVGSLIAFEMAQRLRAEGEEIARLILVDPPVERARRRGVPAVEETVRMLGHIDIDEALRAAMIRTVHAISRAARAYRLAPYPGELVVLCSEENRPWVTAETSEWRRAAKGPFVAAEIAPTHADIVGDGLPRLGARVWHLLAE